MKKILLLSLLITQPALAELINTDINGGCNTGILPVFDNDNVFFTPKFTINTYNCVPGYYLPADALGCVPCLNPGYNCPGGTFEYNPTRSQGISYKKPISENVFNGCSLNLLFPEIDNVNLNPVWVPNKYTCGPGSYLPMNEIICSQCPQNNKCVGGTYSFNENVDQGIEACTNGHAPIGSSVCYPHVLHIGDDVVYLKSTKLTTPSLNIGMDDGVFYANMTITPTRMNNATERYLKIEYDNHIYYVCDDTTYGK